MYFNYVEQREESLTEKSFFFNQFRFLVHISVLSIYTVLLPSLTKYGWFVDPFHKGTVFNKTQKMLRIPKATEDSIFVGIRHVLIFQVYCYTF